MRCIIVEDEPLAIMRMRGFVEKMLSLQLLATFDNGIDALVYLEDHEVDLVFLDLHLGELSGIRLLETAGLKCAVIVTTAYDEYALKGHELGVTDYLLKPFTFERFLSAVSRAKERYVRPAHPATAEANYLFVKTEYRLEKLMLADMLYVEGMRDYRRIHTTHKKL